MPPRRGISNPNHNGLQAVTDLRQPEAYKLDGGEFPTRPEDFANVARDLLCLDKMNQAMEIEEGALAFLEWLQLHETGTQHLLSVNRHTTSHAQWHT